MVEIKFRVLLCLKKKYIKLTQHEVRRSKTNTFILKDIFGRVESTLIELFINIRGKNKVNLTCVLMYCRSFCRKHFKKQIRLFLSYF